MWVRQIRPPGGGDFWIFKIGLVPPPKTFSKKVSTPATGSHSVERHFCKKIFGCQKIPLLALAFGCSHALVAEGFRSRRPHSSLISGLLGVEASGIRSKAFFGDKGVGQGAPLTPQRSSGKPL